MLSVKEIILLFLFSYKIGNWKLSGFFSLGSVKTEERSYSRRHSIEFSVNCVGCIKIQKGMLKVGSASWYFGIFWWSGESQLSKL